MRSAITFVFAVAVLLIVGDTAWSQLMPGYSPLSYDEVASGCPVQPVSSDFMQTPVSGITDSSWPTDAQIGRPVTPLVLATLFDTYRTSVFTDYLFLAPRNVDVPFATHVDGPVENAAELDSPTVISPGHENGIRFGVGHTFRDCLRLSATGWLYSSNVTKSLTLPANTGWIRSEVTHPTTASIATDSLSASAREEIEFQMGELELEWLAHRRPSTAVTLNAGVRYAEVDQNWQGEYLIDGQTDVDSSVSYSGVGPRLGLKMARMIRHGITVHGEGFATVLFGELDADYRQQNATAGVQFATDIDGDFRVVPQLEAELGLGWQNCDGTVIVRAGYYAGFWLNTTRIPSWIRSVHDGQPSDFHETLTFDGLTARVELRF